MKSINKQVKLFIARQIKLIAKQAKSICKWVDQA